MFYLQGEEGWMKMTFTSDNHLLKWKKIKSRSSGGRDCHKGKRKERGSFVLQGTGEVGKLRAETIGEKASCLFTGGYGN